MKSVEEVEADWNVLLLMYDFLYRWFMETSSSLQTLQIETKPEWTEI